MKRMLYALKEGWKNRQYLNEFLTKPELQLSHLTDLSVDEIEAANIAVVVLDFDGVLGPHDADEPTKEAQEWLQKLCNGIGEQRVAILTNKAKQKRMAYFQQKFPSIQFVVGVAKKPYPNGLWEIANYRGIESSRLLLIDDRLLTGMLASCLAPCQARYFKKPLKKYTKHPIKESFFSLLRVFEKVMFRFLK